MISNKKLGNRFEEELCEILAKNGWWAHNLAQNQAGQPADVIAVKNSTAILIDCKVCQNNKFPTSRVECNQESAMNLWNSCGNGQGYFAMKLMSGVIHMVGFEALSSALKANQNALSESDLISYPTLNEWLNSLEVLFYEN